MRIRFKGGRDEWLLPAPPNYGYAYADYGDAEPAVAVNAFAEEGLGAEGSGGVAQSADGDDETDFLEREQGEKRKESDSHETDAHPHPRQTHGAQNEIEDRRWAEVVDFADALHGAANA